MTDKPVLTNHLAQAIGRALGVIVESALVDCTRRDVQRIELVIHPTEAQLAAIGLELQPKVEGTKVLPTTVTTRGRNAALDGVRLQIATARQLYSLLVTNTGDEIDRTLCQALSEWLRIMTEAFPDEPTGDKK